MSTAENLNVQPKTISSSSTQKWSDNLGIYLGVAIIASACTYFPLVFPFSIARLFMYGAVAYAHYSRTNGKLAPSLFAVAAALVDVIPGLSLIPFVPSILNTIGFVIAYISSNKKNV